MEMLASPQGRKQNVQTPRKSSPSSSQKDLWLVVREGSLADVDSSLALLKKNGGNINLRNNFGLTPLHIATWRNHIPIVRRLLAAGADPDARDGESVWSSLHRALHFGHLAVASVLLQSGASISLEDSKSLTPVDLLSGPVCQVFGDDRNSVATELFSWGSGVNYQLGTGNAHIQKLPCKVDALHDSFIKLVSAAKFHSVAVSARGEVYTWGFGRGGRLGHPDFDIHSGQAAVITPRQVTFGLGSRRVRVIAAAKHHTVLAAEGGEVFTWGSNREGQLGYAVDTQPTPRRVTSLKSKIVAVAAANKHTAVVSDSGEVFTWGCNREGQLGYGTSNSASNYTPMLVEYLKRKVFAGVAAAKCHTIVLGADGEVYTWGHRLVTLRRVVVSRNLKKSGGSSLKFHRTERLHVVAIAAGMVHSMALTDDGTLFYWLSADPDLRCQQLYSLSGKNLVSISAGKYWSAVVTATGDIYTWDGKKGKDKPPAVTRLSGVKRATSVSVGETHLLIVSSLYHPIYPSNQAKSLEKQKCEDDVEEFDEDFMFGDVEESTYSSSTVVKYDSDKRLVPSLKSLCEKAAAESLVEPRNALQMLEIADSLGADDLKKHCEDITIHNLDYVLTFSTQAFANASLEILVILEHLLDQRSSEPWSYRRFPTPTASFPVLVNSEEEDSEIEVLRTRDNHYNQSALEHGTARRSDSFFQTSADPNEGISKQVRALRKNLQQIEMLEIKQSKGHHLDDQQVAKLQSRSAIESTLAEFGTPVEASQTKSSASALTDVKVNRKPQTSKKQRRKSKQKALQEETRSEISGVDVELSPIKDLLSIEIPSVSCNKEEGVISEMKNQIMEEVAFVVQEEDSSDLPKTKISSPVVSKKKNRKGGLSMFLSGALDDIPKEATPSPQTPRSEGPAWGGAKVSKGSASLREIQEEQSKTKGNQPGKSKEQMEDNFDGQNDGKVLLGSFLSKPIPVASARASPAHDADKSTPSWVSGTPPLLSRPSFRDIQAQQGKKQRSISGSPKTTTAGFSVATGQGSPSDSPAVKRWFKPEMEAPSSLRSIQIEEKAMKDLKRFYSSVKIVRNTT